MFISQATDRETTLQRLWLAIALMLLAYGAKSADITLAGLDPVLLLWGLLALPTLKYFKKRAFFLTLNTWLLLAAMFLIGFGISEGDESEAGTARIFLSFVVVSTYFTAYFCAPATQIATTRQKPLWELAFMLALSAWIYLIYREQFYVSYAVRAVGATNYLTLSDLLAILTILAISRERLDWKIKSAWLIVGITGVLLLGSRATIVFLTVSILAGFLIENRESLAIRVAKVIAALATLLACGWAFVSLFDQTITYRLTSLGEMSGDESYQGRSLFLKNYFDGIAAEPSCLVLPCFPAYGEYVHSILSVHQYFGLPGLLIAATGLVLIISARLKGWQPAAPILLIFTIISLIFARPWISFVFPVYVSYMVSAFIFHKKRHVSRRDIYVPG